MSLGGPQGPPKGAQGRSKHGTRWNPQRKPHSLAGRLYAFATVYNTEPAGTHWNPQRNPHSLVGTLYTVGTVLYHGARWNPLEPAAEPALFQGRSTQKSNFMSHPVIYLYY